MSHRALLALVIALGACGDDAARTDAGEPPPSHLLGMNDVTMLVPLPADPSVPVIERMQFDHDTIVERSQFIAFVVASDMAPKTGEVLTMDDYHVVGIRWDLCDRGTAPCAPTDDGRLRLVLQATRVKAGAPTSFDIGVHLFFTIPNAELPDVVAELRRLAAIQDAPHDAPLMVNPALAAGTAEYADRLRALVDRYAVRDHLMRMTVLGQEANSGAFAWSARGMERHYDELVDFPIPEMGLVNYKQKIQVDGGSVYLIAPIAATAAQPALNGLTWASTPAEQRFDALDALEQFDNPTLRANADTQCMGCHVATFVLADRAARDQVDPAALPSRYVSARDTSVGGVITQDPRVVRGLGWAGPTPAISQRVANETALVADEMEHRFPPP